MLEGIEKHLEEFGHQNLEYLATIIAKITALAKTNLTYAHEIMPTSALDLEFN